MADSIEYLGPLDSSEGPGATNTKIEYLGPLENRAAKEDEPGSSDDLYDLATNPNRAYELMTSLAGIPVTPEPRTLGRTIREAAKMIPYGAVQGVRSVLSPIMPVLEGGVSGRDVFPVSKTLEEATQFWKPDLGKYPDFALGVNEKGMPRLERTESDVAETLGNTIGGIASVAGPIRAALTAGKLVSEIPAIVQAARPVFRSILTGMVAGGLTGEGQVDQTLENAALFAMFEGLPHLGGIPDAIRKTDAYRKATIKERGLMLQGLDDVIRANPDMTEGEILRRWPNLQKEALARRNVGEEMGAQPQPGETTFRPESRPQGAIPEPVDQFRTRGPNIGSVAGENQPFSPEIAQRLQPGLPGLPPGQGFELNPPGPPFPEGPPTNPNVIEQGGPFYPPMISPPPGPPPGETGFAGAPVPPPTGPQPGGGMTPTHPSPSAIFQYGADRLGIMFNGLQTSGSGKQVAIFTDPESGQTFGVMPGESIQRKLDEARKAPAKTDTETPRELTKEEKESTFIGWIQRRGGLWDPSLPGEVRQFGNKEAKVVGLVNSKTGQPIDTLTTSAIVDGWLPEGSSTTDFLSLLGRDIQALKSGNAKLRVVPKISKKIDQLAGQDAKQGDRALVEKFQTMKKEGFNPVMGDVNVGDLNQGDQFLINDEKYTHQGFDTKGNAIIKDGETFTLDPFEKLAVDGIKKAREAGAKRIAKKSEQEIEDDYQKWLKEIPRSKAETDKYLQETSNAILEKFINDKNGVKKDLIPQAKEQLSFFGTPEKKTPKAETKPVKRETTDPESLELFPNREPKGLAWKPENAVTISKEKALEELTLFLPDEIKGGILHRYDIPTDRNQFLVPKMTQAQFKKYKEYATQAGYTYTGAIKNPDGTLQPVFEANQWTIPEEKKSEAPKVPTFGKPPARPIKKPQAELDFSGQRSLFFKELENHYSQDLGIKGKDLKLTMEAVKSLREQIDFDFANPILRAISQAKAASEAAPQKTGQAPKIIAHGFTQELIWNGSANYSGHVIKDIHEFAKMAQVFRNPKFENLRIFYVKGDRIVGHMGLTSKMPAQTGFKNREHMERTLAEVKSKMNRLGADGFYVVHNHPSGHVQPSPKDLNIHQALDERFDINSETPAQFKGGVIINGGKYATLQRTMTTREGRRVFELETKYFRLPGDPDKILQPSVEHGLLGTHVTGPDGIALLAEKLKTSPKIASVAYLSAMNEVRVIQDVPLGTFNNYNNLVNYLRGRLREFGSTRPVVILPQWKYLSANVQQNVIKAIKEDRIGDAMSAYDARTFRQIFSELPSGTKKNFYDREVNKSLKLAEAGEPDIFNREILARMNKSLKAAGYDIRGADDLRRILEKGTVYRDGKFIHKDYQAAYDKAIGGIEKRKGNLEAKKEYKNIDWSRLRTLGKTANLREAGYIAPDWSLVDLSGKREGGPAGHRALDHREVGGTAGMQELMDYGYIRMDFNSGSIDIGKKPTNKQISRILELARRKNGEIIMDLTDGLGEYSEGNDYYRDPERTFSREYPLHTRPERILADIKRFFEGETPLPLRETAMAYGGKSATPYAIRESAAGYGPAPKDDQPGKVPSLKKTIEGLTSGSPILEKGRGAVKRTLQGLSEEIQSPERVLSRDPAGKKSYELIDKADQRKNAFLYQEGQKFQRSAGNIKIDSEESNNVGMALDGQLNPEALKPAERKLYDFLKNEFDFLINRYARQQAGSDEAFNKALALANRKERPRISIEQFENVPKNIADRYNRLKLDAARIRGDRKLSQLSPEQTDEYWKTRDEMKDLLHQEFLKTMDEGTRAAYLILSRRIKEYLPHIFDPDVLLEEFKNEIRIIKNKLGTVTNKGATTSLKNRLRELEEAVIKMENGYAVTYDSLPRNVRFKFFETRKGKVGYSFDAMKAFQTYLNGIARKMYDEPAIREAAELHKEMDPDLKAYHVWYLRHYMGWDHSKLEPLANAIASFEWIRTLGFNPRSAIVNLTQRINTIAEVGEKWSAKGEAFGFTKEGNRLFDETGIAKEIPNVLMEGGGVESLEKARAIAGFLFNQVELGNRKHAFLSAYLKDKAQGKSEQEAIDYGERIAHKTQFRYGRVGMPRFLTRPGGRLMGQFSSFSIKQMELMNDWARNNPLALIKYLAYSAGITLTAQQFLNIDLSNALGFVGNYGELIEALKHIPAGDWRGVIRHMRVSFGGGGGVLPSGPGPAVTGAVKIAQGLAKGKPWEAVKGEVTPVIGKRLSQAYEAVAGRQGKMFPIKNKNGHIMYFLTGPELATRTMGPKTYTESKSWAKSEGAYLLEEERKDVLSEITRALLDNDKAKVNKLAKEYQVFPSEDQVFNEAMKRNTSPEQRPKGMGLREAYQAQREGKIYR